MHDRVGQRTDRPRHHRPRRRHRLERGPARLVGARGHQDEAVGGGEHRRQVAIAVAGEDDVVAQGHVGHEGLQTRPCLALANEQQPSVRELRQEQTERRQQRLVAPIAGEPRHRHDHG